MVAIHVLQSSAQQYLAVLFWLVKTAQSIKSRITTANIKHVLWHFELVLNKNRSAYSQKNCPIMQYWVSVIWTNALSSDWHSGDKVLKWRVYEGGPKKNEIFSW